MGGAPQASSAHTVTDCSPSTSRMAVSSSALQFLRDFDSETATCCFCEGSAKLACKVNHCVLGSNTPYCACEPCLRRDVHKAPVQIRRSSKCDAVDAVDLARLPGIPDTRDIQRYSINEKDVVFLRTRAWKSRQPLASECLSCKRPLKTASCSFCSLQCKLDAPARPACSHSEGSAASLTSSAELPGPKRKTDPARALHCPSTPEPQARFPLTNRNASTDSDEAYFSQQLQELRAGAASAKHSTLSSRSASPAPKRQRRKGMPSQAPY